MSKMSDMVISAIIKRGILYEARNCNVEFDIPLNETLTDTGTEIKVVKVAFKADNMSLRIEKES